MENLPVIKKDETVYGELVNNKAMGQFINDNEQLSMMMSTIDQQTNSLNRISQNSENSIQRHYNVQASFNQIVNTIGMEYSNLANSEQSLLSHINTSNYPYGIWRYKKEFFYRPKPNLDLCRGNIERISEELSSRYPMNICIIPDLNNIPNNIKEIKFNTVSISIKSIIVIEDEVIDTIQQYEIFQNNKGHFFRNLVVNTEYLKKRFINFSLNPNVSTKTRLFIQRMTTLKDSLFLINRLGRFFKNLQGSNLIVMVGNKDISEGIFWNRVIVPMFSTENYITLTDDVLKDMSIEEILKGKLLIHIAHIPKNHEYREKLKELLIRVAVNKSYQVENKNVSTFAQVIITLDEADYFIKDFEHLSDIFYIDSERNILSNINEINDVSLFASIERSLIGFAEELSAIGTQQLDTVNTSSGNKNFLNSIEEMEISTDIVSSRGLNVLDPYSDNYENIISNNNRFKHSYIIANQGFGKSQLIISLICRDIFLNDCSVVLLDPHGDLAEDLLKIITIDKERLVYIDPFLDTEKTPVINLFDSVEDTEESIHNVSQVILSVLKTINGDEKFSGAMEDLTENCIKVLLREGDGSFLELYKFLNGTGSKNWIKLGKNSPNTLEEDFFNNDFEGLKTTRDAVRRRLKKLLNDPKFSAFMNGKSTINLEQLVNTKGKIIIINIASGRMPNTYQYYMKFLVGYLQLIALKRVSTPMDERVHTQLYLDEFHLFLDKSRVFEEVLTGARKYKMFLTFAHQLISQIRDSSLKETITTIPTRYFIGNIANKTIEILSNALNTELDNPESSLPGEFYFQEDNKDPFKIQNTDRFLDATAHLSPVQLQERIQYQLACYYDSTNPKTTSQPTDDELLNMVQIFKSDFTSKNLTETSCLHKLSMIAPERFEEIAKDFEFVTIKDKKYRPRVRQKEISTVLKLAFKLDFTLDNSKFIQMLKGENDIFNQTSSGTRLGEFTVDGASKTEQYYYF